MYHGVYNNILIAILIFKIFFNIYNKLKICFKYISIIIAINSISGYNVKNCMTKCIYFLMHEWNVTKTINHTFSINYEMKHLVLIIK